MERTHYIFVDFENVHDIDLDLIAGKPVLVVMVLGKKHISLPVRLVTQLLKYPGQVRLVETGLTGKNALDFVLSYEVGVQSTTTRDAAFHILSRDKGFDALIAHLLGKGIVAARHDVFTRIPALGAPQKPVSAPLPKAPSAPGPVKKSAALLTPAERVDRVAERLQKSVTNRPKRKKTLLSHTNGYFGKELSATELQAILDGLIARGVIEFGEKDDVIYKI